MCLRMSSLRLVFIYLFVLRMPSLKFVYYLFKDVVSQVSLYLCL